MNCVLLNFISCENYYFTYVPPMASGGSVFGLCLGMHYFVSFLVLQSSLEKKE